MERRGSASQQDHHGQGDDAAVAASRSSSTCATDPRTDSFAADKSSAVKPLKKRQTRSLTEVPQTSPPKRRTANMRVGTMGGFFQQASSMLDDVAPDAHHLRRRPPHTRRGSGPSHHHHAHHTHHTHHHGHGHRSRRASGPTGSLSAEGHTDSNGDASHALSFHGKSGGHMHTQRASFAADTLPRFHSARDLFPGSVTDDAGLLSNDDDDDDDGSGNAAFGRDESINVFEHKETTPLLGQGGYGADDVDSTEGGEGIAYFEENLCTSSEGSDADDDDGPKLTGCKRITTAIMYGVINSIVLIPVMISFAQIIFRDPYFESAMPYLIKLVMLSSTVHQAIFTLVSSLPFAIGQVQDAGLIFLSSMATSIVRQCQDAEKTRDETFATVLCWLAMSTALLGLALIITGKLKLASLVQYLPMPVVGGYLAYIGFYCLLAGLSLMSGAEILGVLDMHRLFHKNEMILIAPGIVLGLALIGVTTKFKHFAVLPICLMAIPLTFHVILLASDTSLTEARDAFEHGWLAPPSNSSHFWLVFEHFEFKHVYWAAIPKVLPTWFAMYFVVAFSSSLDVAAIQMELGKALDFNHELLTVGVANLVSGLSGGYTGSYIFSQTIFTMRSKSNSRIVGVIVILFSIAMFMVPFSILAFIPKLFFGSILTFIALELMWGWLIQAYRLVHFYEFFIIWFTFLVICFTNLEIGMAAGVGLAILVFILKYSRSNATRRIKKQGSVVRPYKDRQTLNAKQSQFVVLEISGFIFFGSSVGILRDVKSYLEEIEFDVYASDAGSRSTISPVNSFERLNEHMQKAFLQSKGNTTDPASADGNEVGDEDVGDYVLPQGTSPFSINDGSIQESALLSKGKSKGLKDDDDDACLLGEDGEGGRHSPADPPASALASSVTSNNSTAIFLVLNFSEVTGIDATAIRTCFLGLKQIVMERRDAYLCLCGLRREQVSLLRTHGVLAQEHDRLSRLARHIRLFEFVDDALVWGEDLLLGQMALIRRPPMPLSATLSAYLYESQESESVYAPLIAKTKTFFEKRTYSSGDVIFVEGDEADGIYFLEEGDVVLLQEEATKIQQSSLLSRLKGYFRRGAATPAHIGFQQSSSLSQNIQLSRDGFESIVKERRFKCRPGSFFGDLDIVLNNPQRTYTARTDIKSTIYFLPKSKYQQLRTEDPSVFAVIAVVLAQTMAASIKNHVNGVFV